MARKVLILGGTTGGRVLAEELARDGAFDALLSFAGRTQSLKVPEGVPHRVGGFGGAQGLTEFLRAGRFEALVDATHPFAAQMSRHAALAAGQTGVPLLRLEEPAWQEVEGDAWTRVATMDDAARALGPSPKRVFLSIGRLEIAAFQAAPHHDYLARAIDAFEPDLPRARVMCARGPFTLEGEIDLFTRESVQAIVSKNAGTSSTYPKLAAARALGLPVIMVERPHLPLAPTVATVAEARAWLGRTHGAPRT